MIQGPGAGLVTTRAVGAFQVDAGTTATLSGLTISGGGGRGLFSGSGISNLLYATLTVNNCAILDNFTFGLGGGISNLGCLTVESTTIAGNWSVNGGGGIANLGTLTVLDSTIANNFAIDRNGGPPLGGGGIVNFANLTAVNSTIAYNHTSAPGSGGGLDDDPFNVTGAQVTLYNTIVALNTDPTGADDIASAPGLMLSSASGYNLVGVDETGSLINGTNGNQVGVANPGLGQLANNGGATPTIAVLPGSPAIDAGSNALAVDPTTGLPLTTDQRGAGFSRTVNETVDIGASEHAAMSSGPTFYTVNGTDTTGSGSGNAGDIVYVINQANANTNPDGSVIQFDPAVFNSASAQTITLTSSLKLSERSGSEAIQGLGRTS